MSSFVPTNYDLRTALVFCYHLKKTAAESDRMLVEAYGEHALGKTQYFECFKTFKSGNFDVKNEDRGKPPKKFEDWDQKGAIYYELLKPVETVNTNRYQQQMTATAFPIFFLSKIERDKRRRVEYTLSPRVEDQRSHIIINEQPDYRRKQHNVIFLHNNAPSHTAKRVKERIETFS